MDSDDLMPSLQVSTDQTYIHTQTCIRTHTHTHQAMDSDDLMPSLQVSTDQTYIHTHRHVYVHTHIHTKPWTVTTLCPAYRCVKIEDTHTHIYKHVQYCTHTHTHQAMDSDDLMSSLQVRKD